MRKGSGVLGQSPGSCLVPPSAARLLATVLLHGGLGRSQLGGGERRCVHLLVLLDQLLHFFERGGPFQRVDRPLVEHVARFAGSVQAMVAGGAEAKCERVDFGFEVRNLLLDQERGVVVAVLANRFAVAYGAAGDRSGDEECECESEKGTDHCF